MLKTTLVVLQKSCSDKFHKNHRKTPVPELFLINLQAFLKTIFLQKASS